VKPAAVHYYFDADILGIAKIFAAIRPDVTFPGDPGALVHKRIRPPCPIANVETDDDVWIPIVTAEKWLIVTRDAHIRDHKAEIEAVRKASARMVVLSGLNATATWDQLEVLMRRWRGIERLLDKGGPFIYLATLTTLTELPV
jgi:hypothetical protein